MLDLPSQQYLAVFGDQIVQVKKSVLNRLLVEYIEVVPNFAWHVDQWSQHWEGWIDPLHSPFFL